MALSKFVARADMAGHRRVQDDTAVNSIKRIYRSLDDRLYHLLVVGYEKHYDPDKYHEMMNKVWEDWAGKNDELENITDEDIQAYVDRVCHDNRIVVCGREVCSLYSLEDIERISNKMDRAKVESD